MENSMDIYHKKQKDLFERWKTKYNSKSPSINVEGTFTHDGIVYFHEETEIEKNRDSWKKWQEAIPKILFILKEAPCDNYNPNESVPVIGQFFLNMVRWKYAITELFKNKDTLSELPSNEALKENKVDGFAIMEIKKLREKNAYSDYKDILKWAIEDREFLKEQIEMINPDVIVCCGTWDAYFHGIYERTKDIECINAVKQGRFLRHVFKHNRRIVVEFYHPSYFGISVNDSINHLSKLLIKAKQL